MASNLDRYKKDLERVILEGDVLLFAMQAECYPDRFKDLEEATKATGGNDAAAKLASVLQSFRSSYQSWYSPAKALIRQLLPDRLEDFVRYYEKPKSRKDISSDNYTIEDYLKGLSVTRGSREYGETVVGPDAAIPQFKQQLAILKSVQRRFESSLFDIRQLVQADLFDSELDAAEELAKHKFTRAAGALAGVVLERHLSQVCENHSLTFRKKKLGISDFNDALKNADVIDVPTWRSIQHLGDIRNLCDHDKEKEPSKEQVSDLIGGVQKVTKTLF